MCVCARASVLFHDICLWLNKIEKCGGLIAKSCPTLATPWTVDCWAPLFMEFSKQEHWSGLPFPSPGDLPIHVSCIAGRFLTD